MKLAVLGAKGGVGQKLIELAFAAKHQVVAIELDWSDNEESDAVTRVEADVLNDDLSDAFSGGDGCAV